MIEALTEPFAYAFFVRALLAGLLIGGLCGALSTFIVLRRMSYIGHGLAHAVVGGAAVGMALGANLYIGAAVATVVSALLIDRVARRPGLYADAAIGIVTTSIFAVGVAVLAIVPTRLSVEALLFGNILGVGTPDLLVAGTVGLVFAVIVGGTYRSLVFTTFDPQVAFVHGVRVERHEAVFHLLTAAVVVASVRVLGALLIAAAVVIPAATARLVTKTFGTMLIVSTVLGVVASIGGLYASYHADLPSGPSIVLVGATLFAAAFGATALIRRLGAAGVRHSQQSDTVASSSQ